ncbi:MAG: aminopeptidase [Firmicutes bacterium]|nr:aminopeptidase [Bacillota bacterium]
MGEQSKLAYARKAVWEHLNGQEKQEVMNIGEDYKGFLARAKTERELAVLIKEFAEKRGFVPLDACSEPVKPGDKIYRVVRGKSVLMAVAGEQPLSEGANVIGAHVDSPRLDLKVHPLCEDEGLALLKTHYYGGIKKYHWLALPLALHGVIYRRDGSGVGVNIGEDVRDPVFTISDLLPHLAKDQMEKKLTEAFPGESLRALCGSLPVEDKALKNRVKENILRLLHDKYGIEEEDLVSAELELVPAIPPRDVGFDESMVGAYGQDDRACAYAQLRGLAGVTRPLRTAVAIFADKEEIGSVGNTGMQSSMFADFMAELLEKTAGRFNELALRRSLNASRGLSADVSAALDPGFAETAEKDNTARLGCGVVLTKYTGSRGKSGCNDAHAEFLSRVIGRFNERKVIWQTGELGKVDQGGGGTIAYMMAAHGMDVVDCGVGLLGMHSPFEVSHKADLFMMIRGCEAFWSD